MAADLAKCEKLVSTPIPLGYTRSSVRRPVVARWPPECPRDSPRSSEHDLGRRSGSSGSGSRCCPLPSRARSPTSKPARGGRTSRGDPRPPEITRDYPRLGTWWEDKPLAELPVLLTTMLFISFIFLSIEDTHIRTHTHTHTHSHTASSTRTGPCRLDVESRGSTPVAPKSCVCGEVYLSSPHRRTSPSRSRSLSPSCRSTCSTSGCCATPSRRVG